MPRHLPVVLAAMAIAPTLAAQSAADARWLAECRDRDEGWRVKHCEVRVSSLKAPAGAVTVDPGKNGAVSVQGWESDSIEVHARIQTEARSGDEAAELARGIRVLTSGATIGVEGPERRHAASWGVSFVVFVPRRSDLKLDTYNGPIAVSEVSGRMSLTAYNGPVALRAVGGDVHARTTNGPLDIELTGARWEGAGLDAETTNGPVDLAIPEGYSAQLEFGTVNGPMTVEFPLTVTIQGRVGRRITTALGTGGASIRAVTTNGPVAIRRN
jgi:Putative adhesin